MVETINKGAEFSRDENFHGIVGIKGHEENISVEMWSDEFF